jgi:hypothetical protein
MPSFWKVLSRRNASNTANLSDLIKDWVSHPAKFRADGNGVYSISSLEPQFKYIAMMTCRLYGREDTTHFFLPWVPLIHTVTEGCSFDWAKLLSEQSNQFGLQNIRRRGKMGRPLHFLCLIHHGCHLFHDAFSPNELELDSI